MSEKEEESPSCFRRYLCHIVVGSFLLIGTVLSVSLILTGNPNPIDYFFPVDPPGATEAIRWDATTGLDLLVENACDDTWALEFDRSILDWNQTDALNLRTRRTAHDYDCGALIGRLRVCNGDYGNTDWKGINIVFMQHDYIVHSVSKLNDFHLKNDAEQRLYTMCHELGHGFGLPHTDENHFNRDRGDDCMDYTRNPGNNLVPGSFNLDLLVSLYGTPTEPRVETPEPAVSPTSPTTQGGDMDTPWGRPPPPQVNPEDDEEDDKKDKDKKKKKDKDDKDDRRLVVHGNLRHLGSDKALLDSVFSTYSETAKAMEAQCNREFCAHDMGNGYKIHLFKMLVE